MSKLVRLAPLILFVLLVAALIWRLATPPDANVHSAMTRKPLPSFILPRAAPGKPPLSSANLADGRPHLLNIFASWCVPCVGEVRVLQQLKSHGVRVEGIAVRDRPSDLTDFLARNGDPYDRIGSDTQSQVQISLGSSGVPESFIVDGRGVIREQHIGAIEASDVPGILAKLEQAQ